MRGEHRGGWHQFRHGAGNTAWARTSGPTDEVSVEWTLGGGGGDEIQPSPAVVDGTVYEVTERDSVVFALDAGSGNEEWSRDDLGIPDYEASSPALVDGRLFVSGDESLFALDAGDGSTTWSFELDSSLEIPAVDDGTVYVGDGAAVTAIDAIDGTRLWRTELDGDSPINGAPTVASVIYATAGGTLYALDGTDGTVRWSYDTGSRWFARGAAATSADFVYVGDGSGVVHCLSVGGSVQWTHSLDGRYATSSPVPYGDTLYVKDESTLTALGSGGGGGGGGSVDLLLDMDGDTAAPGGEATVTFRLSNRGDAEATGLEGFVSPPSDDWELLRAGEFTTLGPGATETATVTFAVPDDASGEYSFGGLVEDDAGNSDDDTAKVTVEGAQLALSMTGGSAPPGGTITVDFSLANEGSTTLERVSLGFGEPLNGWKRALTDPAGGTPAIYSGPEDSYTASVTYEPLAPGERVEPARRDAAVGQDRAGGQRAAAGDSGRAADAGGPRRGDPGREPVGRPRRDGRDRRVGPRRRRRVRGDR